MTKRVCVLASGGVDSAVLVAEMLRGGREVHPLYVRSGLYWEEAELEGLRRYLRALRHPRLRALAVVEAPVRALWGRHWGLNGRGAPAAGSPWKNVFLPGRNLILLSQAGVFCGLRGIPLIAHGVLKGNPFADASPDFRRAMERAFRTGLGANIRIVAPFTRLTKAQVVRRVPGLPLHLTFSCLRPSRERPCGLCSKCEERSEVLGT